MSCPACGRDNRPGARFCADCGAAQAARCAACAAELPAGARFCDGCGTPVAAGATGAQTRKVVTIVFADLAGSTSIQEALDPESVRHLMDRFNGAMRTAVERHAGAVVKFTGDGLMAAFGVRTVAEDDAWRAVRAAVAMQDAFTALAWDADISLRVGVNTGEVIVTEGETDVVGDAVNVAARLEAAAALGGVLVGEETWRLTRHLARFEAVTPLTLKGKAEPVPAYRLLTLGEDVVDATAPFVGRETELARLVSLFEEVEQGDVVRLATIVGSPGLGKSRLAAELVAGLRDRATVLEARFSATTAAATFAPVVDALRAAVGDDAIDDVVTASPQEAFLAIRRSVEALASERPVVLLLEDLHWAEPLALDLVEHLVEWTQDAPVLLLALARPELRESRPALVDGGGSAGLVTVLEGLDASASERLACDLLETDELPPALLSRILVGSEGNPLFVRELVRMLVDDGVLRRHGDGWRPTIEVDAITVPPTIQSLLAARVERLPADERTVLECAAIVGREFYRGAVAELVPAGVRGDLDVILERLRQKEMVEPEGTYWIDEPVLRFHHVLLRDAAYRRLLKEVRAELHERYAHWLQAKANDAGDNDEVLGYHLEQAHQYRMELGVFDDHTAVVGRHAAERLAAAGRRALDRDDLPAAAGLVGRALARMDGDDPDRPGLLIDRCEALVTTGALADGALAIAELEELAAGSPRLRAWASCFSAQLAILTDPGHLQETVEVVEHAAAELAKLADAAGAAKAHAVHASALARLGRVAETEAALDRALAAAREAGDTRRATAVLAGAPLAALWGPSPVARASGRCLDVVRVLRITTSATTVEATSLRCQAVLEALRGRTDAARRMLASARRSLEELGHRHGLLSTDMFAGLVELLAEDPVAAEDALRRAHDGFLDLGAGADAGQAAALLGRALLAQGRSAEAEELTIESERLGGADLKTAIAWRAVRAEALARRGSVDEALELARAAVALAEPTDALLDQADTHLAMATVLQLAGRGDQAGMSAERAVDLYERKGATVLAKRARSLVVTPSTAGPERTPEPGRRRRFSPNAVTVACERAVRAFNTGDMQAYVALFAPDATILDHVHSTDGEPYAMTTGWASFHVPDDAQISVEPLMSLGDRHALVQGRTPLTSELAGPAEVEELRVMRVGSDGRLVLQERFRPDQLHLALARLVELHAEDEMEGAEQAASVRLAQVCRLVCPESWGRGMTESAADDAVLVDHRTVVNLGTLRGHNTLQAAFAEMDQLAGPTDVHLVDVLAGTPLASLLELSVESRPRGAFEFRLLTIVVVGPDGLVTRIEYFDPEQLEEAHARFDELTVAPAVPPNLATKMLQRYASLIGSEPATADDLFSPKGRYEDRRHGLRAIAEGEDAIENYRIVLSVAEHLAFDSVATRGTRLAVARGSFRGSTGAGPIEAEFLQFCVCDDAGRVVCSITFDLDDLEGALAELDAQFLNGEAAPFAETWNGARAFVEHYNARNWNELEAILHPDFAVVDHRPASFGTLDGPSFLEWVKSMIAMAPDIRSHFVTVPVLGHDGLVGLVVNRGTVEGGGPFELTRMTAGSLKDGRLLRLEYFEPDELDRATASLDELTAAAELRSVGGTAVHGVMQEYMRAYKARDLGGLRDVFHPDATIIDHRPVGWGRADRARFLELLQSLFAMSADTEIVIANVVRIGPQGMMAATHSAGHSESGGAFELAVYLIVLAERGAITHYEMFPLDAMEAAEARFDELTAMADGSPYPSLRLAAQALEFWGAGDWEGLRRQFHDDAVVVDHRSLGWGTVDPDAFVARSKAFAGLTRSTTLEATSVPRVNPSGWLGTMRGTGTMPDGGAIERSFLMIMLFGDGLITRLETFDLDAVEGAIRRFEELTTPALSTSALSNRASTVGGEIETRLLAGDRAGFAALFARDAVTDDRRAGLRNTLAGQDFPEVLARSMANVTRVEPTVLATRGERLVFLHLLFVGETPGAIGFEVEVLEIIELDQSQKVAAIIIFDGTDLDAAVAELELRFRAGEAAPFPEVLRIGDRLLEALEAQDWEAFERVLAPDLVVIDHRGLGFGRRSRADYVATTRALIDLAPDMRSTPIAWPRISDQGQVSLWQFSGTYGDGTPFERPFVILWLIRDGAIHHMETFPPDELDAAVARFDELTSPDPIVPTNTACEADARVVRQWATPNVDQLMRHYRPDVVFDDRRPGLRSEWGGREQIEQLAAQAEFVDRIHTEVLATRGDRLMMGLQVWSGLDHADGRFEIEVLQVLEVDEQGLIGRVVLFGPHDLDAAFAELDRRFAEGEGRTHDVVVGLVVDVLRAHGRRDWGALAATLSADFAFGDHRPMGWGALDADGYVAAVRALAEMRPDTRIRVIWYERLDARGAVAVLRVGSSPDADDGFEMPIATWTRVTDSRISAIDYFPVDQLAVAVLRFDELDTPSASPPNRALEVQRRLNAAVVAHDWSGAADLLRPDFVIEDRRASLQSSGRGKEAFIASSKAMGAVSAMTETAIATSGNRVSLARVLMTGERGSGGHFEIEFLVLFEIDDAGLATRLVAFDESDLDLATAELDDKFAGEAAGYGLSNRAFTISGQIESRLLADDADGFAALYAPDGVADDRRAGLRHRGSGHEFLKTLARSYRGITAFEPTALATRGQQLVLSRLLTTGDATPGGPFEAEFLVIVEIDGDELVSATVAFDRTDLDAAFDELDDRFAEGEAAECRNAWQVMREVVRSYNSGDRSLFAAQADGVSTVVDHKLLGHGQITGTTFQRAARLGDGTDARMTCLAVPRISSRGIVAVLRTEGMVPLGGGEWDAEFVVVASIDGDHADHLEFFDPERLGEAIARFDELTS